MELEQHSAEFRQKGIGIAALSYDSPAVLKYFSDKRKISYPLLSDPDSKIIRDFGILNEAIPAGNPFRGIPNPGSYLVNPNGRVISKYFEENYTERYTAADILVKEFRSAAGAAHQTVETKHLRLSSSATASTVRPGQRIALQLDIELAKGMHVYAPGVSGYKPVEWRMAESPSSRVESAVFPKPRILYLKAIKEKVPVYERTIRVTREITIGTQRALTPLLDEAGNLTIEGEFRYQACDAKVCYVPRSVPLKWKLLVEGHDAERAPKELRKVGL